MCLCVYMHLAYRNISFFLSHVARQMTDRYSINVSSIFLVTRVTHMCLCVCIHLAYGYVSFFLSHVASQMTDRHSVNGLSIFLVTRVNHTFIIHVYTNLFVYDIHIWCVDMFLFFSTSRKSWEIVLHESQNIDEWVVSHLGMSPATQENESCRTYEWVLIVHGSLPGQVPMWCAVVSYVGMSHVTCTHESCHTQKYVMGVRDSLTGRVSVCPEHILWAQHILNMCS